MFLWPDLRISTSEFPVFQSTDHVVEKTNNSISHNLVPRVSLLCLHCRWTMDDNGGREERPWERGCISQCKLRQLFSNLQLTNERDTYIFFWVRSSCLNMFWRHSLVGFFCPNTNALNFACMAKICCCFIHIRLRCHWMLMSVTSVKLRKSIR